MKKRIILAITTFLTVFVQSCSPSTAVRVLSLSYEGQPEAQPLNNPEELTNRFTGPKRADEETYIFPGDILTFTVELEDPNFEFISLLAIKFNGQTIRANSDDSIVSTRDCGSNICADFPFEIQAEVSEYVVQEVKFAKLNADSGINAIIDSNSENAINLSFYSEELFPYVESSVQILNNRIQNLHYFNDGDFVQSDKRPGNVGYMERGFFVSNYSRSTPAFEKIIIKDGAYTLDTMNSNQIEQIPYDYWNYFDENGQNDFNETQYLFLKYVGQEYDTGEGNYFMYFKFFEEKYKEIFFFNDGNSIYVDILGEEIFFLEIVNGMKIQPFIEI